MNDKKLNEMGSLLADINFELKTVRSLIHSSIVRSFIPYYICLDTFEGEYFVNSSIKDQENFIESYHSPNRLVCINFKICGACKSLNKHERVSCKSCNNSIKGFSND